MVKSFVALAFIGGVAAGAVYVGSKRTVISGHVMAANMLEQTASKGITRVDCQDNIPIGNAGAVFECTFNHRDGSTARFKYTMNRKGKLDAKLLDSSEATTPRHREVEPGEDPWKGGDD